MPRLEEHIKTHREELELLRRKAATMKGVCRDCRHHTSHSHEYGVSHHCQHPVLVSASLNPVTGFSSYQTSSSCDEARSEEGICGPDGLLWEAWTPEELAKKKRGKILETLLCLLAIILLASLFFMK